jgi:uncharacterized protein
VTGFLLDANVLIALSWPQHAAYPRVTRWFRANSHQGWATCPFTECAFLRIISNRAFSSEALSIPNSVELLQRNLKHPDHRFWPDDLGAAQAMRVFQNRLVGHQQVTDAYLLALARKKGGKLATLDRSVAGLLPSGSPEASSLEVIS